MTYEEYRRELNEALEKADWMNPRDKNGPAYRVLARAARDKALPLAQWQKLHDECGLPGCCGCRRHGCSSWPWRWTAGCW